MCLVGVLSHVVILHDVIVLELTVVLGINEGTEGVLDDISMTLLLESVVVNQVIEGDS